VLTLLSPLTESTTLKSNESVYAAAHSSGFEVYVIAFALYVLSVLACSDALPAARTLSSVELGTDITPLEGKRASFIVRFS